MKECGEAGVGGAVIVSAGFRETGEAGRRLEEDVLAIARSHSARVLGPNCLGYIRPASHLNVTFSRVLPPAGRVAFFSQSGALGTAVLDWATAHQVGFSAFVSIGSMADVDFGDLIDYFGADAHTASIILYIESITDARKFMSAARHFAKGYRGSAPADMIALERALVKTSYLLVDFPEILEMDVNPLQVRADGVCALNARIVIGRKDVGTVTPRGSHLMIPVYPTKYDWDARIGDEKIHIGVIKPEDEPLWADMVASLSSTTAEHRFFGHVGAVSKSMSVRYCHIDYDREIALVALREGRETTAMLGVARLTLETAGAPEGEFAIVVRDEYQGKGIGRRLMDALIEAARDHHVRQINGYVLAANPGMIRFARSLGFDVLPGDEPEIRKLVLRL